LIETLHIATLGTVLAVGLAGLVALLVARNLTGSIALNLLGKFILVSTRSVHTMVWALFFVAVFGPGPLAGMLAIAVHSIGFTGKFLSEAGPDRGAQGCRRAADRNSAERLLAAGQACVPVDCPVSLGHQRARIGGARAGRRRRARHGARYRAVEPLLGPGRTGAARHFRGGDRDRDRDVLGARQDHLTAVLDLL